MLHARAPRVRCPEHGVRQAAVPWAEPGGRFTRMFEALAIDVLLATDVSKEAILLGITWDEAWHIMERAVIRGRSVKPQTLPEHIGIDEKAIAKGHRYMTLVYDLEEATVQYIGQDRKQTSLAPYFEAFPLKALQGVQAISMDMWPPYINVYQEWVPEAEQKIVFDRFHIISHVLAAVDAVRKQEHKALLSTGNTVIEHGKQLILGLGPNDRSAEVFIRMNTDLASSGIGVT